MRAVVILALACTVAGCASTYQPIIDTQGVDQNKYQADLVACRQYAEQVSPAGQAAGGAVAGAILGAALGAVTGAFFHDAGLGAGFGAAIGGTEGVAAGGVHGVVEQKQVIDNCLRHRGYAVLN